MAYSSAARALLTPVHNHYRWHLRGDRADATEVLVRFVAQGQATARVEIEHRGWERLGAAGDTWRERNRQGWQMLLPHFVAAIAEGDS
jgi:hypothetical protein